MDPLTPLTTSYIPSTDAAARFGLTNDHIASLCRRGKVEGRLEAGRLWFVEESSLQAYLDKTQAEREARHRGLSDKLKREHQRSSGASTLLIGAPRSLSMPRLSAALAVALFLAGVTVASTAPVRSTVASVPWEHMSAAVGQTSLAAYDHTFMEAARQFFVVIDVAAELQAGAYQTLGQAMLMGAERFVQGVYAFGDGQVYVYEAVIATMHESADTMGAAVARSFIASTQAGSLARTVMAEPVVVVEPFALNQITVDAPERLLASVFAADLALPHMRAMELPRARSVGVIEALPYLPETLADTMVQGWELVFVGAAKQYVDAVYALGDYQEHAYGLLADRMYAHTAGAVAYVDASVDTLAQWYVESSNRVAARFEGATQSASVWDGWTAWLARTFYTPAIVPAAGAADRTENYVNTYTVTVSPVVVEAAPVSFFVRTAQAATVPPATLFAAPAAEPSIAEDLLLVRFEQLANSLKSFVYEQAARGIAVPAYIAAGGSGVNPNAPANRIDKLDGVTITNATIEGYMREGTVAIGSGGTGTTTAPSYGQVLVGNSAGGYDLVATSSLGIAGGGGSVDTSVANVWTGLQRFAANASTSQLSVFAKAYFGATATSTFDSLGRLGLGTASPNAALSFGTSLGDKAFLYDGGAGSSYGFGIQNLLFQMFTDSASADIAFGYGGGSSTFTQNVTFKGNGRVGIGTTTPAWNQQIAGTRPFFALSDSSAGSNLKHWLYSSQGGNFYIATSSDAYATSTIPAFMIRSNSNVGVGTTTPYAKLSVGGVVAGASFNADSASATSTFAGGLNVGSGAITYDYSGGLTTIQHLAVGSWTFDTDSGIINWTDMAVSSNASAGTVQSYSAAIDGLNVLTVYGESDGSGSARNLRVGIGTSSPAYTLDVASTTGAGSVARFTNATGNCTINPTTTSLSCSSDERLKVNIESLSASAVYAGVLALRPVHYNWRNEATSSPLHTGFIAQEVNAIFPDLVSQGDSGYYTLNYAGFVPYLVTAIQKLADTVSGFADRFTTKELCVEDVCVTRAQFLAMVEAAGQTPTAPEPEPEPEPTPEPESEAGSEPSE